MVDWVERTGLFDGKILQMIKLHRITDTGHSALEVGSLVIVNYF